MSIVLEAVAGAALSAFFEVLFDKLSSPDLSNIFRRKNVNVDADLKNWETILQEISEVLDDAEEKQITKVSVKNWMAELEDLAYDADDILDKFATEALRRKVKAEEPSTSKIRKFIPACCVGLNPSPIMFDANMGSKIKGINTRLDGIVTRKNKLELLHGRRTRTITSREPETSLVEPRTYGRDEDKKEIVKSLLSGESGGAQPSTISILGMGGLGKTTLAKLVYNDDEVGRYFDVKAWGCVSQNFDVLRVTKEILQDITFETCNDDSLNLVQRKLKEQLSGKKFLLILDDVWIENYSDWTRLSLPFVSGAPGSRILITTRHANVSSTMGFTHPYELRELSDDACLAMFTQHALGTSDFVDHLNVEEIKKILERCKGLPLAAKALAGLIRTYDRAEWKKVLNGRIWDLFEKNTDVPSTLRLSYWYLPPSLKKCFAYCSLFPKDYKFEEKELILLWMAEGLVQETKGEKPMEDLGGEYFCDLLKRSFFQQSSSDESLFVMHDLMNDLAKWAARDLCYRLEDQLGGRKQSEISTKVRHFSYVKHSNDCIQKFDDFTKGMHLRTFLSLPLYSSHGLANFDAKYCLLAQLRCLRVLSLTGYEIFELPSSIGNLKHLRYLNLSYTKIKSLPKSTSSLYNLQTLILKGCFYLTKLPNKIENLVNLRHLNITNSNSIREMPWEIAKLKSLQKLCFADMHEWQDWIPCRVECEEFPCLRELSISNCPKLKGEFPHHLPSLEKLSIDTCEQLVVSIPSHSELQVLQIVKCKEVVHESVGVEKLIIKNCELTSLCEDGLMSLVTLEIAIELCQSLVNIKLKSTLRTITIKGCNALESLQLVIDEGGASSTSSLLMNEENLSRIGNNNTSLLEHLEISNCPSLKCVSTIVDLAAKLKRLDIEKCPNLTSLSSRDMLPTTLKVLRLVDCPKLESIVDKLNKDTLLEHLLIYRCEKLRCLPRGLHKLCHLTEIDIFKCNSLISLGDLLPTNLRSLHIEACEKLEALPNNIHNLCHLKEIDIQMCNSLISLGDLLPTNLRSLKFEDCEKLEAWPKNMRNLNFLQDLSIRNCSFPEEGFPTNLRNLKLSWANLCEQVFELGLHSLTSLTSLSIDNGIMDSFPDEEDGNGIMDSFPDEEDVNGNYGIMHSFSEEEDGNGIMDSFSDEEDGNGIKDSFSEEEDGNGIMDSFPEEEDGNGIMDSFSEEEDGNGIMDSFSEEEDGKTMLILPSSLTSLTFENFPNVLFLSWKFFQNQSALKQISINFCPKLASLSEKCFPPSLQRLEIYDCPVLGENCKKDEGIMWSKIANIPLVKIDLEQLK